jgi:hypothetical protein
MIQWSALFRRQCFGLILCVLAAVFPSAWACAGTAVVADDGNNLRAWGGDRYGSAPILLVLNQGDQVRVWDQKGKWTQVTTPEGIDGWVHSACLKNAPDEAIAQTIAPQLRRSIEGFLKRLEQAAASRGFADLRPLLDPSGVFIQGQAFSDAALEPSDQKGVVVSAWYASDVSLTRGTAWDLLMMGTRPGRLRLVFDKSTEMWRPAGPGEARGDGVDAQSEEPLLPTHRKSLTLAGVVRYVDGFPERLKGIPEPESFMEDPRSTPFGRVYKVGKANYLLTPEKGVGLNLLLADRPEGFVLRAVRTLSP